MWYITCVFLSNCVTYYFTYEVCVYGCVMLCAIERLKMETCALWCRYCELTFDLIVFNIAISQNIIPQLVRMSSFSDDKQELMYLPLMTRVILAPCVCSSSDIFMFRVTVYVCLVLVSPLKLSLVCELFIQFVDCEGKMRRNRKEDQIQEIHECTQQCNAIVVY